MPGAAIALNDGAAPRTAAVGGPAPAPGKTSVARPQRVQALAAAPGHCRWRGTAAAPQTSETACPSRPALTPPSCPPRLPRPRAHSAPRRSPARPTAWRRRPPPPRASRERILRAAGEGGIGRQPCRATGHAGHGMRGLGAGLCRQGLADGPTLARISRQQHSLPTMPPFQPTYHQPMPLYSVEAARREQELRDQQAKLDAEARRRDQVGAAPRPTLQLASFELGPAGNLERLCGGGLLAGLKQAARACSVCALLIRLCIVFANAGGA